MGAVAGYDSWRLKGAQPFNLGLDYNSLKNSEKSIDNSTFICYT